MNNIGYTTECDALDCIYNTKKEAEERLIDAFYDNFKYKSDVLKQYPIVKVHTERPFDSKEKDCEKAFMKYEVVEYSKQDIKDIKDFNPFTTLKVGDQIDVRILNHYFTITKDGLDIHIGSERFGRCGTYYFCDNIDDAEAEYEWAKSILEFWHTYLLREDNNREIARTIRYMTLGNCSEPTCAVFNTNDCHLEAFYFDKYGDYWHIWHKDTPWMNEKTAPKKLIEHPDSAAEITEYILSKCNNIEF